MDYSFEQFLAVEHARSYVGTDDAMPDAFDRWLERIEPDEWIYLGNKYAVEAQQRILVELSKKLEGGHVRCI